MLVFRASTTAPPSPVGCPLLALGGLPDKALCPCTDVVVPACSPVGCERVRAFPHTHPGKREACLVAWINDHPPRGLSPQGRNLGPEEPRFECPTP